MRRTLGVGLVLASLAVGVTACSSTPPPTPAPTVEAPTWDARKDAIDQSSAIWDRQRPPAYAYTFEREGPPGSGTSSTYRVSGLEGDVQLQHVAGTKQPAAGEAAMTVEGLYDVARAALASDRFSYAYDPLRGYPTKLDLVPAGDASAGSVTETVAGFTTAATVGAGNATRKALEEVLRRWRGRDQGAWEYTWSRIPAGAADAEPAVWTIHHDRKGTTAKEVSAGGQDVGRDEVSLDATALGISNVLGSGGWADVAVEDDPGFGVLIAVDPSPSIKGDAYWIRVAWTDLALRAAITDIEAAKARWATAQLTDYGYTWTFAGEDRTLSYKVNRKGAAATVTPQGGSPAPESIAYAAPRIEDTFALIDAVLAQGGTVKATYDDKLGYPKRVELVPHGDAGAKGVITIKDLKRR